MIKDTSLKAYHEDVLPDLGEKQMVVYRAMLTKDNWTHKELSHYMGFDINRITPRVGELVKLGLVVDQGKRTCGVTGRTAHQWHAKAFDSDTIAQIEDKEMRQAELTFTY